MNPMSPNYIGSQTERELNSHFVNGTAVVSEDAKAILATINAGDLRLEKEIRAFYDGLITADDLSEEAYCVARQLVEDGYGR